MNIPVSRQQNQDNHGPEAARILIVGCGDKQRRDDGIGPFVVERLAGVLHVSDCFRFLTKPRLSPEIAMELKYAHSVIFVVATGDVLEGGWRCSRVLPEALENHVKTDFLNPESIVGLARSSYYKKLPAWVFSVQGDAFGPGFGITPAARKRIDKMFLMIVEAVLEIHAKVL